MRGKHRFLDSVDFLTEHDYAERKYRQLMEERFLRKISEKEAQKLRKSTIKTVLLMVGLWAAIISLIIIF